MPMRYLLPRYGASRDFYRPAPPKLLPMPHHQSLWRSIAAPNDVTPNYRRWHAAMRGASTCAYILLMESGLTGRLLAMAFADASSRHLPRFRSVGCRDASAYADTHYMSRLIYAISGLMRRHGERSIIIRQ